MNLSSSSSTTDTQASQDLADKAGIQPGSNDVEFCCGTGGALRFLIRFIACRTTPVQA